MSPKFFMYSPLPMYLINFVRGAYEALSHPLDLTVPRDQVTYMILGRAMSAAFGTATISLVYAIAKHLYGRLAGVLAAFFLALLGAAHPGVALRHHQSRHDVFLCGGAVVLDPHRRARRHEVARRRGRRVRCGHPQQVHRGLRPRGHRVRLSSVPEPPAGTQARHRVAGAGRFAASFRSSSDWRRSSLWTLWCCATGPSFSADVKEQITDPLTGVTKPIWIGNFADLRIPELYWFTNLLPWGLGPLLALLGLAGVVWLLTRRDKRAAVVAVFPIIYFLTAGRSIAPFIRYAIPLVPALALTAGMLSAEWLRRPRGGPLARIAVGATRCHDVRLRARLT